MNTCVGDTSVSPRTNPALSCVSTVPRAMMVISECGPGIETRCETLPKASRKRTALSIPGISTRQLNTRCPSNVGGVKRRVWML